MSKQKDDLTWFSGPPPSLGWWPASINRVRGVYRWWDGVEWSHPAETRHDAKYAAVAATIKMPKGDMVYWMHRPASWPARSRT